MAFETVANCVTAHFEIVTPMFLGGADQQAEHIRPASFKGMLRFWWRAVNWGRLRKEKGADATALQELHGQEAKLFGAAAAEEKGGQGCFLMSVTQDTTKESLKKSDSQDAPTAYLLGMGLYDFKKKLLRNAISGSFTVSLRFRASTEQADRASVIEGLTVLGLLGGLGSRTRRGMGSLQLKQLTGVENFVPPDNLESYKKILDALIFGGSLVEPPFSAFSQSAKWEYVECRKPEKVLYKLGDELAKYRSYGKNGFVFGDKTKPVEIQNGVPRFKPDHDEMQEVSPSHHPKRLIFGMPHNYFFSRSKKKVDIQSTKAKLERRASPLFMHVHKLGNEYIGVALMLPAQFLPKDDKVTINNRELSINPDWSVIEKFLERRAFTKGI